VDFYLSAWILHVQFFLESVNLFLVRIGQLLELVFLHEDLVIAIDDVVSELGVDLKDRRALVGNRGHRQSIGDLDDEVGMVASYGGEEALGRV
jgi:hypothetical protein